MIVLGAAIALVVLARHALRAEGRARLAYVAGGLVCLTAMALAAPSGMVLRKTIAALAMPMGLLWSALIAAALVTWWRGRTALTVAFAAIALALTVLGSEPLANAGLAWVEGERGEQDPLEGEPFDAVIVLGGGTSDTPAGGVQLGCSGDRVALGARLHHRGRAPLLVTSGSPIEGFSEHDSARATSRIWREMGVPPEAIVIVDGARTTGEEAAAIAPIARERGWDRVGLVSSASHLARAVPLFEAEGLEVVPLAADVRRRSARWRGLVSLVPKGPAASDLHSVCWELLGRLVR